MHPDANHARARFLSRSTPFWYVCSMPKRAADPYNHARIAEKARLASQGSTQAQGDPLMFEPISVSPEKPLSGARPERRQSRRAGVSLLVHIRSTDLAGGDFEDVRTTINASRKNVYFFTRLDRYYRGMHLRIISPYDPKPGVVDLEQNGEVTRVQRLDGGYGVAVAILPAAPSRPASRSAQGTSSGSSSLSAAAAASASQSAHLEIERRCASRSPFVAPVELIDIRTGSRIQARIADLSLRGCYVDTLNPLPIGSAVRLQIRRADEIFDALANVSSSHVGSGMGLVFADLTLPQRTRLCSWLGETPLPPETEFSPVPPPRRRRPVADEDQPYAVKLIHVLVRKGLLSQSEASELLSDPETPQ
jgi:PilZ domain